MTNKGLSFGSTTATVTIDMSGTGTLEFSATGNIVSNGAGAKTLALQGSNGGIGLGIKTSSTPLTVRP